MSEVSIIASDPQAKGTQPRWSLRPVKMRERIRVQLKEKDEGTAGGSGGTGQALAGCFMGLFTPVVLAVAVGLGLAVSGILAFVVALYVCPKVAYEVSLKLFEYVHDEWGPGAVRPYIVSALVTFGVGGLLCWLGVRSATEEEPLQGIFLGVVGLCYFVGFVAWGFVAGAWWKATSQEA